MRFLMSAKDVLKLGVTLYAVAGFYDTSIATEGTKTHSRVKSCELNYDTKYPDTKEQNRVDRRNSPLSQGEEINEEDEDEDQEEEDED